ESRAELEAELDWLDAKLSDGRFYLVGDRFSRADLTVASLLAGFARPEQLSRRMTPPDALAADIERWRTRPAMRWVIEQYRRHRVPSREERAARIRARTFPTDHSLMAATSCNRNKIISRGTGKYPEISLGKLAKGRRRIHPANGVRLLIASFSAISLSSSVIRRPRPAAFL